MTDPWNKLVLIWPLLQRDVLISFIQGTTCVACGNPFSRFCVGTACTFVSVVSRILRDLSLLARRLTERYAQYYLEEIVLRNMWEGIAVRLAPITDKKFETALLVLHSINLGYNSACWSCIPQASCGMDGQGTWDVLVLEEGGEAVYGVERTPV